MLTYARYIRRRRPDRKAKKLCGFACTPRFTTSLNEAVKTTSYVHLHVRGRSEPFLPLLPSRRGESKTRSQFVLWCLLRFPPPALLSPADRANVLAWHVESLASHISRLAQNAFRAISAAPSFTIFPHCPQLDSLYA